MKDKITFNQLSFVNKVGVLGGIIIFSYMALAFLIGVIQELILL